MEHIRAFVKKYREIIIYLIFGVLTTVVNFAVYLPLHNGLNLSAALSNGIAWVAAVLASFATNKPFVFGSHDWSPKVVFPELAKFVGCRVASGAFETLALALTVDVLGWNGNVMKLLTSIIVVIANYIASKLLVFKNS